MTRALKRATTATLVLLLVLNVTNLLLPTLVRAAQEVEIGPLVVAPASAVAGATFAVGGTGFAPGEALTALVVTPSRQTLALGLVGGGTLAITDGGAAPTADAAGAVAMALATGASYQAGGWSIVLRGQDSGRESWGQFALVAATPTPLTLQATPSAAATQPAPTAPPPTATPAPPTVAPTATPPPASPSAAPSSAAASPASSASTSASAAPSASPSATASASASASPSASASANPSPTASASPSASASAAPSASASPAASAAPSASASPAPSAAPSAAPPAALAPGSRAVVASPTGNAVVRATPSANAAVVRSLNNGALLTLAGESQEAEGLRWWPVRGEGFDGWVVASLLAPAAEGAPSASAAPSASPSAAPTAIGPGVRVVVNAPGGAANLRAQPSASAAIVRVVANGTAFTVTGASQTGDGYSWWPVQGDGAQGWVAAELLALAPGASAGPSASPAAPASPSAAPADRGPGVPPPVDGPALAPSQLLPVFQRAAQLQGIPTEVLLAIGRVESGFDPRAVGPYLPQFAGTEDVHALGMMQFLPSTYRGVMARVDAITGKNLGINGIWDAESSIHAAAIYLRDSGGASNLRRALFAYNNAEWYVDLILAWANHYAGGVVPDPTLFDPARNGQPAASLAAPQNPLIPSNTRHIDMLSPIRLYAPWTAGQTWHAGGEGSFYGMDYHVDTLSNYYTVDFNKGTYPRAEEDDGEPILAAADGIVNNIYQDGAGAWVVELYHVAPDGSQLRTLYVHLKTDPRINPGIRTGQSVYHGTPIGLNGSTGNSTGPHLHFGLWLLKDGQWVSIRPEPMEGQYLSSGASITSTNVPPVAAGAARTLATGFAPQSPSNADRVTIEARAQGGSGPLDRIEVYVNTAGDGSDRGAWQLIGAVKGDNGKLPWQSAPIADGTYRALFVLIDPEGNRTYHGLTNETAVRYTIRRGEPRGSAVVNPRADLALLAPFDGASIASIGARHPVVSGPLRFVPASGSGRPAAIGRGAAIAGQTTQIGSATTGKVREGIGVFVEETTTNLIPNPSFELGPEGWAIRNLPGGALALTAIEGGVFGKRALRLDNTAGTAAAALVVAAGDGNAATWSVHARTVGGPASVALQMTGGTAQDFPLTADWARFTLTGATGGGNERLIVVPAGAAIEIDAAQLEAKPYATTYADGSLGPGYGWDRQPNASLSGRTPTVLQVALDGLVTPERGALGFWATGVGAVGDGAHLLTLGDGLTLTLANGTLVLRQGERQLATLPWVRGETHHYALAWDGGIISFFLDGQVAAEAFLPGFAVSGELLAFIGGDPAGARAANVTVQDLAVWSRPPPRETLATLAGAGEFLHAGVPQVRSFDVTVALASQGLTPAGLRMQFSFDGQAWTAPEPFAATKTIVLPDTPGSVQVYVRFTDGDGRSVVIIDRIQVIARPESPGEQR